MPTPGVDCHVTLQHSSVNGGVAVGFILRADRRGPLVEVEHARRGLPLWADQGPGVAVARCTVLALPRLVTPAGGEYALSGAEVRAALTALPEDIRHAYLAQLRKIVPAACKILLLTTEEPEAGETEDQPFAIAEEISSLYARAYDIDLSHVESLFEADADPLIKEPVRIEHKAYVMTPK